MLVLALCAESSEERRACPLNVSIGSFSHRIESHGQRQDKYTYLSFVELALSVNKQVHDNNLYLPCASIDGFRLALLASVHNHQATTRARSKNVHDHYMIMRMCSPNLL